eukprot:12062548-Heterocapsa_arctica.AAC.1
MTHSVRVARRSCSRSLGPCAPCPSARMMPASECAVRSGSLAKCVTMSLKLLRSARMTREKGEGERVKVA